MFIANTVHKGILIGIFTDSCFTFILSSALLDHVFTDITGYNIFTSSSFYWRNYVDYNIAK